MSDTQLLSAVPDAALSRRLRDLESQIAALQEQLVEAQRLAAIGTIAAVIAHEFNNLLTPIVSYSQFALQSAQGDKPDIELIKKALAKSFQSSTKAGKICGSMLGLARGECEAGEVSIQRLVDETLSVLARDPSRDGIALRVQVQPGLAVVGDGVQLEQVLLNLLINARQAMIGRGGSITIKAQSADDDQVKLQVIDTGPGIDKQVVNRIFEPFFTTKGTVKRGEAKGTGLGLAICKEIVERHHGRIQVQSDLGKGTTFSIFLPLHASAA